MAVRLLLTGIRKIALTYYSSFILLRRLNVSTVFPLFQRFERSASKFRLKRSFIGTTSSLVAATAVAVLFTSHDSPFRSKFNRGASVRVDSEVYMTPADFIDCVTVRPDQPSPRHDDSVVYSVEDVERILAKTPGRSTASSHLFRRMERGIISEAEFVFLFSILRMPISSAEFARRCFARCVADDGTTRKLDKAAFLRLINERNCGLETSVQRFLFGKKGVATLTLAQFETFVNNVTQEIMEAEFHFWTGIGFSMSASQFIRYVFAHTPEVFQKGVERVMSIDKSVELDFNDFADFCLLVTHYEAFLTALTQLNLEAPVFEEIFASAFHVAIGCDPSADLCNTLMMCFCDSKGVFDKTLFTNVMLSHLNRN